MLVAQITREGLAAIGLSVALLWGCVLGQHILTRQAVEERAQVMRQIVRSRQRAEPVVAPAPLRRRRLRSTAS